MRYLLLLLLLSGCAGLLTPKAYDPPLPKTLAAWSAVKKLYPISSAGVKDIRVTKLNGVTCDCMASVFATMPNVIWLDAEYELSLTPMELEMTLVHEMIHVMQYSTKDTRSLDDRQKDAYAAEHRYQYLKRLEADGVKIQPERRIKSPE